MIADFEAYYGYDIDEEYSNDGALAKVLEQKEVFADCGDLLYCRDFILIPDYDTDSIGLVKKPSNLKKDADKLTAYLETREYFLDTARHKVWDYRMFDIWYKENAT